MNDNLFDLSGKTALITGGGRGLGKAMAREFARAGADVMISSRTEEELRATAAEIAEGLDVRVEWMVVDMVDRGQVDGLASEAVSRLGRVDILVNNAGSNIPEPIDEVLDGFLGPHPRAELVELHAPDACAGSSNEGAQVGKGDSHLLGAGAWRKRSPQQLLLYEISIGGPGAVQRA